MLHVRHFNEIAEKAHFDISLLFQIHVLKSLYYVFVKMIFHKWMKTSERAPCIKLSSLKRKSRLWIIETSRF